MPHFPTLTVMAYDAGPGKDLRPIGQVDLTGPAMRAMEMPSAWADWLAGKPDLAQIGTTLPPSVRIAARNGTLRLPDLPARFHVFSGEISSLGGIAVVRKNLVNAEMARVAVSEAASLLRDVSDAELVSADAFRTYVEPMTGEHVRTAARPQWHRSAFRMIASLNTDLVGLSTETRIDPVLMDRLANESLPPFLFGTREVRWRGVDPTKYADFLAWGGTGIKSFMRRTAPMAVEICDLTETWRLDEAAADLFERGLSPEAMAEFKESVSEWNARQTAISPEVDRTYVVAVPPQTSKEEMVDWCAMHLESTIRLHGDIGAALTPVSQFHKGLDAEHASGEQPAGSAIAR